MEFISVEMSESQTVYKQKCRSLSARSTELLAVIVHTIQKTEKNQQKFYHYSLVRET